MSTRAISCPRDDAWRPDATQKDLDASSRITEHRDVRLWIAPTGERLLLI